MLDIEDNHITLHAASIKYAACPQSISAWLKIARTDGIEALSKIKQHGRPPAISRSRKNNKPLTELERL